MRKVFVSCVHLYIGLGRVWKQVALLHFDMVAKIILFIFGCKNSTCQVISFDNSHRAIYGCKQAGARTGANKLNRARP